MQLLSRRGAIQTLTCCAAFAAAPLQRAVVVLGHERCGAVQAAIEVVEKNATFPGSIGNMVEPIVPAVLKARSEAGDLLDNAVRANLNRVVENLRQSGPVLQQPLEEGRLKIVGARYDLDDGKVEFLES